MNAAVETLAFTLIAKPCTSSHICKSSQDSAIICEINTGKTRCKTLFSPVLWPFKHMYPPAENKIARSARNMIFINPVPILTNSHSKLI